MRGLPNQEHAIAAESIAHEHPGRPRIGREHLMIDWRADQPGNQLTGMGAAIIRVDAGNDRPPKASEVHPPDQPSRLPADHPVLHSRAKMRVQSRSAEDDVEVRPRIGPAYVVHADLVTDHAAAPIAAQHPAGANQILGSAVVANRDLDAVLVLRKPSRSVAEPQLNAGHGGQMGPQHFLDHRLGHLLTRLGG